MAEIKIRELPEATTLEDEDLLPVHDVSAIKTKKLPVSDFRDAIGARRLEVLAPQAPGATATINANVSAGDTILTNVDAPAGEPADASEPYYLRITDGSNSEHVVVTNRTDPARTIAAPLKFGYSAGPSTIAYAGPATTPAAAGLMPATMFAALDARDIPVDGAKLDGIEAGADVTDAANVAAAGALMTDGSAAMAGPLDMGAGNDVYNANAFDGVYLRLEEGADQAAEASHVNVYAKDVAGASALHARTDDGAIHLLTGRDQLTSTKTSAHTVGAADDGRVILIDSTGGAFDLDLPDPTTLRPGFVTRIVDVGGALSTNPVTLDRAGSEQISGVASNYLLRADYGEWTLRRDGSNWLLVGRNRCRQVFTTSGTFVVPGGVKLIDLVGRPGAGGGGGGGGGGAGASANVGGGGGGRTAGGGGGAARIAVEGILVTPGESLDVTIGAGGTGGSGGAPSGAGGTGARGGYSRVERSGTTLVRWSNSANVGDGAQGAGAGSAGNAGGASGGAGQTAVSGGQGYNADYSTGGGGGGASGAGGTGNQAGGNTTAASTANLGAPLVGNHANKTGGAGASGGATDGTRGGGGAGGAGGHGGGGDDFGAYGEAAATASDGAGGAAGGGGAAGDPTGVAGSNGGDGTHGVAGRGGGSGGGGGGGGGGATTGGAGGSGGAGGNGSDGILVVEWWG